MDGGMNKRATKLAALVLAGLFCFTTVCQAQGTASVTTAANTQSELSHAIADKKVIYPSEIKSIMIKETEEQLFLDRSKAVVVRFPEPFTRAAIGDPNIADIVLISENEIVLNAKAHGNTNLIIWYETGVYNNYDVIVGMDFSKLESVINNIIQGCGEVTVYDANSAVILKGHVTNTATYEKVEKIAESFIATISGSSIVNLVTIDETEQILLEVRFLEISHSLAEQQGVDLHFLTSNLSGYSWLGQTGTSPDENQSGTIKNGRLSTDMLEAGSSNGQYQLQYTSGGFVGSVSLDDLESKGILKIIANPDLITKNKEEASFLAGGEFPVVTVNQEEVNVEYKDYGVQLKFLPEITERNTIKLKVNPVVSLLDFTKGAVTVNSVLIPALITRRTETVVELEDGKTLVISGLHSKGENTVKSASPLFGNIPILGKFFSTTDFTGDELELIVVVTPHIVTPFDMGQRKKFFDPDSVERVINMSHLDMPEEQANEMKSLLAQSDILREQSAMDLMEDAVTRKYDQDMEKDELKRAEEDMVDYLSEKTKDEKKAKRTEKREVRIQTAHELRAEKERQEELERMKILEEKRKIEEEEQRAKDEKLRAEDAAKAAKEREKERARADKEAAKQRERDEKERAAQQKQMKEETKKRSERKDKEAEPVTIRTKETDSPSATVRETQQEVKQPVVRKAAETKVQAVSDTRAGRIQQIDNEIESKRQTALALYKEGKFADGKAELDSMFNLKQERERLIASN